jgi:hypothetical protein
MKLTASAKSNSRLNAISRHFVICLSSGSTPAALEIGKVYERLRDSAAEATGMLRIIDESGEDYLHPARLFGRVSLPRETRLALQGA